MKVLSIIVDLLYALIPDCSGRDTNASLHLAMVADFNLRRRSLAEQPKIVHDG